MNLNANNRRSILIITVVLMTILTAVLWFYFRVFGMFLYPRPLFIFPLIIYSLLVLIYLPTRIILYFYYVPYEDRGHRPSVSIVVPVYNEGRSLLETIHSILKADYPGKQIIVIDDGSTDDSFRYLQRLKKNHPHEIEAYRFKQNRGKREAMAEGIKRSRGDIVIFVDSDTVIDRDSIKYMVAPFADPKVGGVTGKVKVKNHDRNLLTRMLAVRYIMSFDFYRCTRSAYGGVICLSGLISAYRRSILNGIMDSWLNQQFFGKKCTFGDDRSLTNHVLKGGYRTVYSRKANAYTIVPETLPRLMRMLARWNKSFIREGFILMRFLLGKGNARKRKMLFFDFVMTSFITSFIVFVVLFMFIRVIMNFSLILNFAGSISLMAMIYMSFYIKSERDWTFLYGIMYSFFYMFVLIWILPYALITIKNNNWGTR